MIGGLGQDMKRKMLRKFLQDDRAGAMLEAITAGERELLDELQETRDLLDLEDPDDLPAPEARRELLQEMLLAHADGRFPAWWVEHYDHIDNAGEAAQYANLSEAEWHEQKAEWADRYRRNGVEGDDDELAAAHVRKRYDVTLSEFYHLVVHWPEGRAGEELNRIAFSGLNTLHEHIQEVNAELADRQGVAES